MKKLTLLLVAEPTNKHRNLLRQLCESQQSKDFWILPLTKADSDWWDSNKAKTHERPKYMLNADFPDSVPTNTIKGIMTEFVARILKDGSVDEMPYYQSIVGVDSKAYN